MKIGFIVTTYLNPDNREEKYKSCRFVGKKLSAGLAYDEQNSNS